MTGGGNKRGKEMGEKQSEIRMQRDRALAEFGLRHSGFIRHSFAPYAPWASRRLEFRSFVILHASRRSDIPRFARLSPRRGRTRLAFALLERIRAEDGDRGVFPTGLGSRDGRELQLECADAREASGEAGVL